MARKREDYPGPWSIAADPFDPEEFAKALEERNRKIDEWVREGRVMPFLQFDLVVDGREKETVLVNLSEVSSVRQFEDRRAYGGYFPASEIVLKSGVKYRVHGYVGKQIAEAGCE
jgi:hypothetical protein